MPVTLLDIAPTILGIMNWKIPGEMQGRNLYDFIKRQKEPYEFFTETYTPESFHDRFAIHKYPWYLIFTPKKNSYELYDLAQDPGEKNNIFTEKNYDPEILELKMKVEDYARKALTGKVTKKKDPATLEILKSLGYVK
jgi:hypothetical protein